MVRAILEDGVIRPLETLPKHWEEGQKLVIDEVGAPSSEELEIWFREVDELAAEIPPEDFDRVETALEKADQEAKSYVRRRAHRIAAQYRAGYSQNPGLGERAGG